MLHQGKGVLHETYPRYLGLYARELTAPVRAMVDDAGLSITVGALVNGGFVSFTQLSPLSQSPSSARTLPESATASSPPYPARWHSTGSPN